MSASLRNWPLARCNAVSMDTPKANSPSMNTLTRSKLFFCCCSWLIVPAITPLLDSSYLVRGKRSVLAPAPGAKDGEDQCERQPHGANAQHAAAGENDTRKQAAGAGG